MRHLKSGRALGVKPAHRRAMMRNLVTSVLEHQQIKTTVARAKELRKPLDKMITLGKRGDLNARRKALTFVKSKQAMGMLFGELSERYSEREGGYTRIIRLGPRKGDGAAMAIVQLVGAPNDSLADAQKPSGRRRTAGTRKVREDVAAEVKAKPAGKDEKDVAAEAATQEEAPAQEEAPQAEAAATQEEAPAQEEAPQAEAAATDEGSAQESPDKEPAGDPDGPKKS